MNNNKKLIAIIIFLYIGTIFYIMATDLKKYTRQRKEDIELTYMIVTLTLLTGILICCVIGVTNMKSVTPPRVQQNNRV